MGLLALSVIILCKYRQKFRTRTWKLKILCTKQSSSQDARLHAELSWRSTSCLYRIGIALQSIHSAVTMPYRPLYQG